MEVGMKGGSNEIDPPLSDTALMSQNGCDILDNHSGFVATFAR
jgi:hypothetical protein